MTAEIAIIVSVVLFFVLLASGNYIHTSLFVVGIVGLILLGELNILPASLGKVPFKEVSAYSLSTIPLFVLMAQLILHAGIVNDLFSIVFNIAKGKRIFLGILTLVAGAFLGAVSGSGTATAASLGQIAVPQLVRFGYKEELAASVAATAGSLSGIIPPSVILILFGVITETPISFLFIGAIIPGTIITFSYILVTLFFLLRDNRPEVIATDFKPIYIPKKSIIVTLTASMLILLVVFVGIYSGFTTPTEAGALGSFTAFIAVLILGRVNLNFIYKCMKETAKVTVMVMLIIVSAKIFARFISLSMIPRKLALLLEPLFGTPGLVLAILIAIYFIFFMLLEGTAVIVMTTPILLPIINAMNIDTIWFGVLVGMCATIGLVTPPIGMSVYAVCGITKIKIENVFKISIVFALVASVIAGAAMIFFPQVATWLPSLM